MVVPVDLSGNQVYTTLTGTMDYPLISVCDETLDGFPARLAAVPPAEKRLLSAVSYEQEDAELRLLDYYLMSNVTMYVGTDGGKKDPAGSFSWILCTPEKRR